MKNSFFELLLHLFEKTITQLKEHQMLATSALPAAEETSVELFEPTVSAPRVVSVHVEQLKPARDQSVRVFTSYEQLKLTKASHQFLVRMVSWGVISPETLELIINRLVFSESRYVSLQETKWTIRHTLANSMNADQLAFLELVLYQNEDGLSLH